MSIANQLGGYSQSRLEAVVAWTKEVAIASIRLWMCVEDYLNLVGNGVEREETWLLYLALDPNFSIHKMGKGYRYHEDKSDQNQSSWEGSLTHCIKQPALPLSFLPPIYFQCTLWKVSKLSRKSGENMANRREMFQ